MDCSIYFKHFKVLSLVSKLILLIVGSLSFIYKASRIFNFLDTILCMEYFSIIN